MSNKVITILPGGGKRPGWYAGNFDPSEDCDHRMLLKVPVGSFFTQTSYQYINPETKKCRDCCKVRLWVKLCGECDQALWAPVALGGVLGDDDCIDIVTDPVEPPVNNPPVMEGFPNQADTVGAAVNLAMFADDADGDTLTWSATGLPDGLVIDAATGAITGTVTTAGNYNIVVTVDDGNGGMDTMALSWEVVAANQPPVLAPIANQTGVENVALTLATSASDGDGDALTWSATGLPDGVVIDAATGALSGTPTVVGSNNVTITVDDGNGGTDSQSFTWEITAAPVAFDLNLLNDAQAATTEISGSWIFTPVQDIELSAISQFQAGGLFPSTTTKRLLVKTGGVNGSVVGRSEDLTYTIETGVKTYQFASPVPNATPVVLTAGTAYHVVNANTSDVLVPGTFGDAIFRTTGPSDLNDEVFEGGAGTPDKVLVRVEGTLA